MAENVNEVADNIQNIHFNAPENVEPLPGAVRPYVLEECDIELPLHPIMRFAISESVGPLDTESLMMFLRHEFDSRRENFMITVGIYTTDFIGCRDQINRLRKRINEIKEEVDGKNDDLKKRINQLIQALSDESRILDYTDFLPFSNEAREAMQYVGHQGPLNGNELADFLNTGRYGQVPEENLINQLESFRRRFNDNLAIEEGRFKFIYDRIIKIRQDFRTEMVYMRNII